MKSVNSYINISYILCLALLFGGCQDHYLDDILTPEGVPTTITIGLGVELDEIETRAGTERGTQDSKIYDIVVFVFNDQGHKASSKYIEAANSGAELAQTIEMSTFTGENKTIIGIANVSGGIMAVNIEELLNITNITELIALTARLDQEIVSRGRGLLMSGAIKDDVNSLTPKKVTVSLNQPNVGTLYLRRLDAKITFRVKTKEGSYSTGSHPGKLISNAVFISDKWRIMNCGKSARMIQNDDAEVALSPENYFHSPKMAFERDFDDPNAPFGSVKFTFFILQSKLKGKETISSSTDQYSQRTKRDYTQTNNPFVNANAQSPYVELTGTLNYDVEDIVESGAPTNKTKISAKVKYTILLGDTSTDPNDYNTNSGIFYTYNVTVLSAENIIVEAQDNKENQSGAEGTVSRILNYYEFDAHYDATVVTFNALNARPGLSWHISTPYETSMYSPDDVTPNKNIKDYLWVYFKLNDTDISGDYLETLAPYPGEGDDQIYTYTDIDNAPKSPEDGATDAEKQAYKEYNDLLIADYISNGKNKLIDIRHLARILSASNADSGDNSLFGGKTVLRFTAFINEFYYQMNPMTGGARGDLWKDFVNVKDRVLGLSHKVEISEDKQSTFLQSDLQFTQKSIQTIYDEKNEKLQTAWGAESLDDTGQIKFTFPNEIKNKTSPKNGLQNTRLIWGITDDNDTNPSWNTYINSLDNKLITAQNKINNACMRLNRDNNGDGKIDKNEVRWYLAAIDQLSDMWVGQNSLHMDSHLYRFGKKKDNRSYSDKVTSSPWGEELYLSSTQFGSQNHFSILWSGEGASVSSSGEGWMPEAARVNFFHRCLRNLGLDNLVPEKISSYKQNIDSEDGNITYTIDLEYLEASSIRSYRAIGDLPSHTERSLDNLPYHSFEVSKAIVLRGKRWIDVIEGENEKPNCPEGWRLPNQRELILILSTLDYDKADWMVANVKSHSFASSAFSLNIKNISINGESRAERPGFAINDLNDRAKLVLMSASSGTSEFNGTTAYTARCVRDVVQ